MMVVSQKKQHDYIDNFKILSQLAQSQYGLGKQEARVYKDLKAKVVGGFFEQQKSPPPVAKAPPKS